MKVSIYKGEGPTVSVMVEASPGKGRPPLVLRGVTPENVTEVVLPVIVAMRRPREPTPSRPVQ